MDIDPAEIGKNRAPDVPIVGDVKRVLAKLNKIAAEETPAADEKTSHGAPRMVAADPRVEAGASLGG